MKKVLLCLLLTLTISFPFQLFAQLTLVNEPDKPSVQAAEMTKYGKYDAQLYTGRVSVSVPIYVYRDSRFTIPVSLEYSYNGLVANRQAGIVGLGWTLNAGGCITREVRGIPDELYGTFRDVSGNPFDTRDLHGFDYIPHESDLPNLLYEGIQHPGPANVLKTAYEVNHILYETSPDIYHFSCPGHSGSFYRNPDGSFTVFHTSSFDGNYRIEKQNFPVLDYNNNVNSLFVITTADGYKYTFGEYNNQNTDHLFDCIERNIPDGYDKGNPNPIATPFRSIAFMLRKIESPDGATVTFNYSKGFSEIINYSSSLWLCTQTGDNPANMLQYTEELNTACYLTSIDFPSGKSVEFFYEDKPEDRQGTFLQGTTRLNINAGQTYSLLDSISTPALGVKLSYIYNTLGNPYPFLDKVRQDGIGTYRFDYEGTQDRFFPAFGTTATDHWGYLNKSDSLQMNSNSISLASLSDNPNTSFDETPSTSRNAHAYSSSIGQMNRIIYPTGGYSLFLYEPNHVGRNLRKIRSNLYSPAMCSSGEGMLSYGPGQRISSIINFDSDGNPVDTTSFRYFISLGSTGTSGSLLVYPRYSLSYAGTMPTGEIVNVQLASSSGIANYEATPVEYSRVEEIHQDGSKTVHSFTGWDDCPDEFNGGGEGIERLYTTTGGIPAYGIMQILGKTLCSNGVDAVHNILAPATSNQRGRGREKLTEVYSADGALLHRTATTFERDEEKPPFYEFLYVGEAMTALARNTAESRATLVISSDFLNGTQIHSQVEYEYNRQGQKKSEVKTLSNGDILKTNYTFIPDIPENKRTAVQKAMLRRGRIDSPVRVTVLSRPWGTAQEVTLSCDSLTFEAKPRTGADTLFLPAQWLKKDCQTGEWKTFASYLHDSQGNIIQKTDANGISTAFIWYADGKGVALRVENATIAQVETALGYTISGGIGEADTETMAATLRNALPQSEVSWYKWLSYGLPSKICDPTGRITHYTYDAAHRLNIICDDSQNPVERYDYQTLTR